MGAIGSILTGVTGLAAAGAAMTGRSDGRREQDLALRQLQKQQELQMAQAQEDAALQRDQIALSAQQVDEQRKAALKRAVARQRASFGAQGIGSSGGSAQAVLLGMFDESEDEAARRVAMDDLRLRGIDLGLAQRGASNILARTQAQERTKVNALSQGLGDLAVYTKAIGDAGKIEF